MPKAKKQTKSQARRRYEERRPVKSFRIDSDLDESLKTVKELYGYSLADIVRIGVGKLEVKQESEMEVREKGYQDGFQKAKEMFGVTYKCSKCDEALIIKSDDEKKAAAQYFREHGWCHSKCIHGKVGNELSSMMDDVIGLFNNSK